MINELVKHGIPLEYVEILRNKGIEKLNPVQVQAMRKGLLEGKNLLVTAPTASGKTLIGEIALVNSVFSKGSIGVYLVPLRALASEKYDEFKSLENIGLKIGITTGDYESPAEYLGKYDIVIATYERFDSLLRLKPRWLNRVGIVVIDEFHMVNDYERGPILEMIVARLLEKDVQIIGLSATIGNPHILSKWIKAELVDYPYRPIELIEGVYDRKRSVVVFVNGKKEKINYRIGSSALNIALQTITNGHQVLVFVNNRRKAEEWAFKLSEHMGLFQHLTSKEKTQKILDKLKESPSKIEREKLEYLIKRGIAYHHAGLSMIARRVIEQGFRERIIRAIFATPTLAAGVNLPARRVLVSVKRYSPLRRRTVNIAVYEYKQMAGRAGRPGYDTVGEAIIYDASSVQEGLRYIRGSLEPVTSKLNNERSLRIHTLALISSDNTKTYDEIISMFKNTLFAKEGIEFEYLKTTLDMVLDELVEWGMIEEEKGFFRVTKLGRITSLTYLDPLSVNRYLGNIKEHVGDLYLLTLITLTPDYIRSRPYIPNRIIELYEDEAWQLSDNNIIPKPPTSDEYEYYNWLQSYVHARMLHEWINEVEEDVIIEKFGVGPGDIYSARDTAAWIAGALAKVERVLGNKTNSDKLEKLSLRLEHGVKEDALDLISLYGIGRVRARILIKHGIRTLEELAKTPREVLESLPSFGPGIVGVIYEQLKNMGLVK